MLSKFKVDGFQKPTRERTWKEKIVEAITDKRMSPCISQAFCDSLVFGTHTDLVEGLAISLEYSSDTCPRVGSKDLARVTQFRKVHQMADALDTKQEYVQFLKKAFLEHIADPDLATELKAEVENIDKRKDYSFSRTANLFSCPFDEDENDKERREHPLRILANLPLPIYLTTSYYTFLEDALKDAGKNPKTEICYWDDSLRSRIPSVFANGSYEPNEERPLVYHICGIDKYPCSLVLTEDDYLDLLITLWDKKEDIPKPINTALSYNTLLLLGYGVRTWEFRVLFRGMIRPRFGGNDKRPNASTTEIALQLTDDDSPDEQVYLKNYLIYEAQLKLYEGNTHQLLRELWEKYESQLTRSISP